MNTKEICRRLSVTTKMLRVYEESGLIHPRRGENNYRDYSEEDALRVQLIAMLRNLGFSIREIGRIFREKEDRTDGVLYAFYFQLKAIELQQRQLEQNRRNITSAINQMLAGTDPMESLKQGESSSLYEAIRDQWNFDEMAENYVSRFLEKDLAYQSGIEEARDFLRILPPESRILDVVISTFLLHHIDYHLQDRAVDNLLARVRPGGILYIVDRCFLSEEEKQCRKWIYEEMKDLQGLLSIDTEYFLMVGNFCEMLERKGCCVEMKKTGAFVRSFRITVDSRSTDVL